MRFLRQNKSAKSCKQPYVGLGGITLYDVRLIQVILNKHCAYMPSFAIIVEMPEEENLNWRYSRGYTSPAMFYNTTVTFAKPLTISCVTKSWFTVHKATFVVPIALLRSSILLN